MPVLIGLLPRLIRMVVAVVDKGIRDCVPMIGVESLEESLGCFLLLITELLDQIIRLHFAKAADLAQFKVGSDGLDGVELIGTDRCLSWLAIRGVDGDIDPVVANPGLRRGRYPRMP